MNLHTAIQDANADTWTKIWLGLTASTGAQQDMLNRLSPNMVAPAASTSIHAQVLS